MGILAVLGRERRTIAELGIILAVVVLIPAARLAAIDELVALRNIGTQLASDIVTREIS